CGLQLSIQFSSSCSDHDRATTTQEDTGSPATFKWKFYHRPGSIPTSFPSIAHTPRCPFTLVLDTAVTVRSSLMNSEFHIDGCSTPNGVVGLAKFRAPSSPTYTTMCCRRRPPGAAAAAPSSV